jgi:hypothetical protein
MCLMREDFAVEFLEAAKAKGVLVPALVLIETDGWTRRDAYFAAGATAIVQQSAENRILEAVSSLTGLSFRHCPRVPYQTVVDVSHGRDRFFLETSEISATSVSIRGVPTELAQIGQRAELHFMMLEPPVDAVGVVVRVYEEHGENVAAFNFAEMSQPARTRIGLIVAEETQNAPPLPDPVGMTHDLSGAFTADLVLQLGPDRDANGIYLNMLYEWLKTPTNVQRLPSWLERVGRALTGVERTALLEGGSPAFARAAIEVRIRLHRMRLESSWPIESESERAFEICQALAADAAGSSPDVLADVTEIRAALLRSLYGDPKSDGLEVIGVQSVDADAVVTERQTRPPAQRALRR